MICSFNPDYHPNPPSPPSQPPPTSRRIMGEFVIRPSMAIFVWILAVAIIGINLYIVGGFVVEQANGSPSGAGWLYTFSGIAAALYLALIAAMVIQDLAWYRRQAGDLFVKLGRYDTVGGSPGVMGDDATLLPSCQGEMSGGSGSEDSRQFLRSEDSEDGGDTQPLAPGLGQGSSSPGYAPPVGRVDGEVGDQDQEGRRHADNGDGGIDEGPDVSRRV